MREAHGTDKGFQSLGYSRTTTRHPACQVPHPQEALGSQLPLPLGRARLASCLRWFLGSVGLENLPHLTADRPFPFEQCSKQDGPFVSLPRQWQPANCTTRQPSRQLESPHHAAQLLSVTFPTRNSWQTGARREYYMSLETRDPARRPCSSKRRSPVAEGHHVACRQHAALSLDTGFLLPFLADCLGQCRSRAFPVIRQAA